MREIDLRKIRNIVVNNGEIRTKGKDEKVCGFEAKKTKLIEKLAGLLKESGKDSAAVKEYKELMQRCEKSVTEEELTEVQRRYEDIIYKKSSCQKGINIYAGMKKNRPVFKGKIQDETEVNIPKYSVEERIRLLKDRGVRDEYYIRYIASYLYDKEFIRCLELLDKGLQNKYNVEEFSQLNDEEYKRALELLKYQLIESNIPEYVKTDEATFELMKKRLNEGANEQLIMLDEQSYQKGMSLVKQGLSPYSAASLAQLTDEEFEKAKPFIEQQMSGSDIADIVKNCDEDEYNRALDLVGNNILKNTKEFADEKNYEKVKRLINYGVDENTIAAVIYDYDEEQYERAVYMASRGLGSYITMIASQDETKYNRIMNLIENGTDVYKAIDYVNDITYSAICPIEEHDNSYTRMMEYMYGNQYEKDIKNASAGAYQSEMERMLNPNTIYITARNDILKSGMSSEEYLKAVKQLSKSTYKLAMNTPNQYLSDIDTQYTKKVNGKYPVLTDKEKKIQQRSITLFFAENIGKMLKALKYIDVDTLNQMMDRRTSIFKENLNELNKLTDENYKLLSDLIKCKSKENGKSLTARQKIQLCQIVEVFQNSDIDKTILEEMTKKQEVDIDKAKRKIEDEILHKAGITDTELSRIPYEKRKLNDEYAYLALKNEEKDTDGIAKVHSGNGELYTVIKASVLGDFDKFITDRTNKYGQTNYETEKEFKSKGLNYKQWLKPEIEDVEIELGGHKLKVSHWERKPQKDLFMGNETTCCTAIGTGINAASTPLYLLNTAFNVVDLISETGKRVGISRVFMSEIDREPALIMDNLELNQSYVKEMSEEELKAIRDGIFKYINRYADAITNGKGCKVYFCGADIKNVPAQDLKNKNVTIKFIGDISEEDIYINSCNFEWVNPKEMESLGKIKLYKVPKIKD